MCQRLVIDNNLIRRGTSNGPPGDPTGAIAAFLMGISTENSQGCVVSTNTTRKMGYGIKIFGANQSSVYVCNSLERSWNAVFFDQANITDQFPGNVSQANKYVNTVSSPLNKMSGSCVAISPLPVWFYNSTNIYSSAQYNPVPSGVGNLTISGTGNGVTDICASNIVNPPGTEREMSTGSIVRNERIFSVDSTEHRYADKRWAYKYLKSNTGYLNLGQADDSVFQNFYNTEIVSNNGKYEAICDSIHSGNFSDAVNEVASMNPQCNTELLNKQVLEIYLKYLNTDSISSADSALLNQIAWTDCVLGGEAVYSSRVLLKIDPSATGTVRGMGAVNAQGFISTIDKFFHVYPNPSNEYVIVESLNEMNFVNAQVRIYSSSGQLVKTVSLLYQQMRVEVKDLNQGIYHLVFITNDQLKQVEKLVIIK